ncbi:MAG TPA: alpha/beta hydrolase [Streptosporangiaceae bacterium]
MTIAYDAAGDGPAVVLLHSGVCDRRMWDPQWPVLAAAGYRVVRCDLRGYGDTPPATERYSDAADVSDLMDALGLDQVAFIGSSYGGKVSLEVAALHPDRVAALALLCSARPELASLAGETPYGGPGPELMAFGAQEDELLEAGDVEGAVDLNVRTWLGPEASDRVREQVHDMQRHAFGLQLTAEDVERDDPEVDLSAIHAPSLVVSGGRDLADFRQIAVELSGLLAGASHVELPWAGHLPSLERPADVTAMLVDFLTVRFTRPVTAS